MGETDMVTGPRAKTGSISFVASRVECEEKTVMLKIENFSEFLTLSNAELEKQCLTFVAGTCALKNGTCAEAKWQYLFQHIKKKEDDFLGGYLRLQNDKSKVKCAEALYSLSLSSGDSPITSFAAGRTQYASIRGWGTNTLVSKAAILEKIKATNTLNVSLQVKVFSSQGFQPFLQAVLSSPSAVDLERRVNLDFEKLLDSEDEDGSADVEISVPSLCPEVDPTFYKRKVHKCILMARSSVFAKMFAKESDMVEAKTGKVVIEDMTQRGLNVLIRYLYTGKVSDKWVKVPEEIINVAEKYDLGMLKQFCGRNLIAAVNASNAWKMFQLAKLHKLSFAQLAIEEFVSKNARAVLNAGPTPTLKK